MTDPRCSTQAALGYIESIIHLSRGATQPIRDIEAALCILKSLQSLRSVQLRISISETSPGICITARCWYLDICDRGVF